MASVFLTLWVNSLRRIEYAIDKTRDRRQYPATTPREALWGGTAQSKRPGAIALLKQDHREVKTLFGEYERARGDAKKTELARDICLALTIHAQIEEDIFYPAVRKATGDDDLLNEAAVEHAAAKQLIADIEAMSVDEELLRRKGQGAQRADRSSRRRGRGQAFSRGSEDQSRLGGTWGRACDPQG